MFDIGLQELALIFVIALLVFGPKNLPQLGRSLGRAMREFRRASDEFRNTIETNLEINAPDPLPPTLTPAATDASTASPAAGTASMDALPDTTLNPNPVALAEGQGSDAAQPSGEPYLAQRGAKLFHRRECGWTRRIPEAERQYFKTVAEAREAGFGTCPACEPWEPA
jgi:sec-independent protein translocase protein TatA